MHRILIAEDEKSIRDILKYNLESEGFEIDEAVDGLKAILALKNAHYDLLLLDLMMPNASGTDVLQFINSEQIKIATIILSAKDQAEDRIQGLKMGADDYVQKPFNLEELILRINKLLARSQSSSEVQNFAKIGKYSINFDSFLAETSQGIIQLTKTELGILKMLIQRPNSVVSRKEILTAVYGFEIFPNTRTIDNFILAFRKYFEEDTKNPKHFISVRGVGYKFNP